MLSHYWEVCSREAAPARHLPSGWYQVGLRSADETEAFVRRLSKQLDKAGFSAEDVFAVGLAVQEAIINGLMHGNGGDPAKQVRIRYHLTDSYLLTEVEDEGSGFRPEDIPDPRDPKNLNRECGRGLFLMRNYMTWMRYNAKGNRVTLCKQRG